jgi:hypothetical protein
MLAGAAALSSGVCYWISYRHLLENPRLSNFWAYAYGPPPWHIYQFISWNSDRLSGFFKYIFFDSFSWIWILVTTGGIWRAFVNKNGFLIMLAGTLGIALLFSWIHIYPFYERMLLFWFPFAFLLFGYGADWAVIKLARHKALLVIFLLAVIYTITTTAVSFIRSPAVVSEMRPLMSVLKINKRTEDYLYIYYASAESCFFLKGQI